MAIKEVSKRDFIDLSSLDEVKEFKLYNIEFQLDDKISLYEFMKKNYII
jgi:hypothetical protein